MLKKEGCSKELNLSDFDRFEIAEVNYSWEKDSYKIEFSDDESRIDEDSYLLYQRIKPLLEKFYEEIYTVWL